MVLRENLRFSYPLSSSKLKVMVKSYAGSYLKVIEINLIEVHVKDSNKHHMKYVLCEISGSFFKVKVSVRV